MNNDDESILRESYLTLLKKNLIDIIHCEKFEYIPVPTDHAGSLNQILLKLLAIYLKKKDYHIVKEIPVNLEDRLVGKGSWPKYAETMCGLARLNNLQQCVENTIKNGITGDLIETGVWRGGSTILMRAILKSYGIKDKLIWVADSFEGLPAPDKKKYPADSDSLYHTFSELSVSMDDVKNNFSKYDLLDEQVKFLKGWFKDTLPTAPIKKLSVLRLDGDMYEATMDALVNLYSKLSVGGYIIIDDYLCVEGCRKALSDFRGKHNITEEIKPVDWTCAYWQKTKEI